MREFQKIIFEQGLRILLDNAAKYSPDDRKEIVITVSEDEQFVITSVSDKGIGISEEDIERRYVETFKNLKDVLKYCDLAAFYDNTKNFHRFAIFRNGEIARISTILPTWFKEKELVCSTNLSVSVSNKLL